uniref:ATP-grasp domain-containing protein n=1 Tax=Chlamydomonas leiostraca TaxID=1034604 RepID=A0A7S0RDS3_9CHLO|mmetsp:Transcript_20023/g.50803  ORF Transcript_20023/g.50803 Transcript_20023/m.50803 type:complete len:624 (+) Transcript_20023:100-1971(+)
MALKSALTASLAGGAAAPPPMPAVKKSNLDPQAFPCIEYADVLDGKATAVSAVSGPDPALDFPEHIEIVGSAPATGLIMPDGTPLTDYALNPRRRRGGEEAAPEMAASLGTSVNAQTGGNWRAVIGSLPKGLTNDEKMRVKMSVPPSPSAALLKEMNPGTVSSRTGEGRKLRRKVLAGSVMVFVTAGYSGKRFIFEKAHALGIKSIVLDMADSWIRAMEAEGKVAAFVPIDFNDADTVFEQCLAGIKAAAARVGELDGVTTFSELAVPLASRLAEKLGLPHNAVEAVDAARDKHRTRELMAKAGLPTPRHYRIEKPTDVAPAGAHVGYPAVIKPVSGAASIGVIRVNNEEELHAAYARVVADMKKARIVAGAITEGDPEDDDGAGGNAGEWIALVLMLEEYLDGQEVDVDLVLDGGVPVYGAVTDNWPTVEPYFNETGSNCPSILPRATQAELCELAVRSVQALGLTLGVFHVELKATSRGARLIEVNCRMGGGPVRDTNLLVWGVDLVEEHLMASAGIPVRPPVARTPLKQLAEYSVNAAVTGVLQHTGYLDTWQGHPEVLYARPLVQAGHKCVCVADGLPTWVCEIMVTKPNVHDAIAFVKDIDASLDIPITPAPLAHHHH